MKSCAYIPESTTPTNLRIVYPTEIEVTSIKKNHRAAILFCVKIFKKDDLLQKMPMGGSVPIEHVLAFISGRDARCISGTCLGFIFTSNNGRKIILKAVRENIRKKAHQEISPTWVLSLRDIKDFGSDEIYAHGHISIVSSIPPPD